MSEQQPIKANLLAKLELKELEIALSNRMTTVEVKSDLILEEVKGMRSDTAKWRTDITSRVHTLETKTDDLGELEQKVDKLRSWQQWLTAAAILFATAAPFVVQWIERSVHASIVP